MEQKKPDEHHGSPFNVFFLGVVVGVALTLLLTTKKGRRILKTLTDEGMNHLGKWEDSFVTKSPVAQTIPVDVEDIMEGQDYAAAEELKQKVMPSHVSEHAVKQAMKVEEHHSNGESKPSPSSRRFFKGAKKS